MENHLFTVNIKERKNSRIKIQNATWGLADNEVSAFVHLELAGVTPTVQFTQPLHLFALHRGQTRHTHSATFENRTPVLLQTQVWVPEQTKRGGRIYCFNNFCTYSLMYWDVYKDKYGLTCPEISPSMLWPRLAEGRASPGWLPPNTFYCPLHLPPGELRTRWGLGRPAHPSTGPSPSLPSKRRKLICLGVLKTFCSHEPL